MTSPRRSGRGRRGWLPTEAAAELLIGHRAWLLREDFLQVAVESRWEVFRGREMAAVDFAAAADAVQGVLPCSAGERQVLLVAASIADGIPVDLREAALCMDAVERHAGRPGGAAMPPGAGCRWRRRLAGDRRAAGHGEAHPATASVGGPGAAGAGQHAPARGPELLVVLPDGSKRLVPASWTDVDPAAGAQAGDGPGTLGAVS